jgi:hypothetical protein
VILPDCDGFHGATVTSRAVQRQAFTCLSDSDDDLADVRAFPEGDFDRPASE